MLGPADVMRSSDDVRAIPKMARDVCQSAGRHASFMGRAYYRRRFATGLDVRQYCSAAQSLH